MSIMGKMPGALKKGPSKGGVPNMVNSIWGGMLWDKDDESGGPANYPAYPSWQQPFMPDDKMEQQIRRDLSPIGEDLAAEGRSPNLSPYAMLRQSQADAQAGSQAAAARSGLAMRGGLRSGADERVGETAAQNALSLRENIAAEDAKQKMGLRQGAAQMDIQKAGMGSQAGMWDRSMMAKAAESYNQAQQNQYQTMGSLMGAEAQARATENSGKK